ncbi:MAG: hypothetical protein FWE07_00830 [Turicibacter sp.]|nr:hypothetical protein [Turicibacter sp.]
MATLIFNSANTISNNSAANGGGGYVAAGGAVTDTGSTYNTNTATNNGGGVYLEKPATGQTTPMYASTGTTYTSNAATTGDGGAIFDATAPPYSFPPVSPTNYPNLVIDPTDSFQGNTASVAYTGPAPSLTGTPSIADPAAISIGNNVLNNYDINYRANPVAVTKVSDVVGSIPPGATFNYTITITNNGNQATANPFTITDALPQYLTLTGTPTSPAGTVTNSGTATNLNLSVAGSVPPGGTTTVTLPVTVSTTAPAGQLLANAATVDPGNNNPPATGTEITPPTVATNGITVTKSNNAASPIPPGTTFDYLLTIQNIGSTATANPITITDNLPPSVTLTGTPTSSDGAAVTNSGTNTALNLAVATSLAPNGSITVTLPVTVSSTAPVGELAANAATVDPGGDGPPVTAVEPHPPVVALPQLLVEKTNDAPTLIPPGANFNYIITITNTGGLATANPITITDNLPPSVTLTGTPTSSDGAAVTNSGTNTALNLSVATSLAPNGSITITLPVTAATNAPTGQLTTNTAIVDPGGGGDPETGIEPNPPTIADPLLTVTKTNDTTAPIPPGTTFNYTLVITNIGTLPTANPVTITDNLPPSVTLTGTPTSSDGAAVTNSGTNTALNLSVATSLAPNGSIIIALPVTVSTTAPAGQLAANTAVADPGDNGGTGTGVDPNPPIVTGPDPDVRAELTVSKTNDTTAPIPPGTSYNYIITITNTSSVSTENPITITDILPQYVTLTGAPSSTAGTVTNTGTNTNLNLSVATAIPAGSTITITLPVTVSTTAPAGQLASNTAVVDPGGGDTPTTGIEITPPTVIISGLSVTKTNDTTSTIAPGDAFDYIVTIQNTGSAATGNPITITDTLPPYVTLNGTPTSTAGAVTNSGTNTNLNLSVATSIPAGETITVIIPVVAATNAPTGQLAANTIVVDPGGGDTPTPGVEITPPIVANPKIEVNKVNDTSNTISPGETFNYIITITNRGSISTASPFTITDTLPQYVSLNGTPTASDGSIVTNNGTNTDLNLSVANHIAAGESITITLPVIASTSAPEGQLTPNTVVVDPGGSGTPNLVIELVPPIVAIRVPELEVTKQASDKELMPGDSFYYTLTITNTGSVPTANPFTIEDVLPRYIRLTGVPASDRGRLVNLGDNQNLKLSAEFALAPGETAHVYLPVTLSDRVPAGQLQPNVAVVNPGNGGNEVEVIEPNPPIVKVPRPHPKPRPPKPPRPSQPCQCDCCSCHHVSPSWCQPPVKKRQYRQCNICCNWVQENRYSDQSCWF